MSSKTIIKKQYEKKEKIMTLTLEEEEKLLTEKLQSARHALKIHKEETSSRKFEQNKLEKELETIEQACVDYMLGNGLLDTENLLLGKSYSVDVPDVDVVPEEFVRVKITKEPNKILIKELKPQGNWYTIKENYKLTTKGAQ